MNPRRKDLVRQYQSTPAYAEAMERAKVEGIGRIAPLETTRREQVAFNSIKPVKPLPEPTILEPLPNSPTPEPLLSPSPPSSPGSPPAIFSYRSTRTPRADHEPNKHYQSDKKDTFKGVVMSQVVRAAANLTIDNGSKEPYNQPPGDFNQKPKAEEDIGRSINSRRLFKAKEELTQDEEGSGSRSRHITYPSNKRNDRSLEIERRDKSKAPDTNPPLTLKLEHVTVEPPILDYSRSLWRLDPEQPVDICALASGKAVLGPKGTDKPWLSEGSRCPAMLRITAVVNIAPVLTFSIPTTIPRATVHSKIISVPINKTIYVLDVLQACATLLLKKPAYNGHLVLDGKRKDVIAKHLTIQQFSRDSPSNRFEWTLQCAGPRSSTEGAMQGLESFGRT